MRYAIVSSGGKQYVAREGEALEVDRLNSTDGEAYEFSEVLLAAEGDQVLVGAPTVRGAKVKARIVGEVKGRKIDVFHYQPKKRRRRMLGHRQIFTRMMVEEIDLPGVERQEPTVKKPAAPRKPKAPAKKSAARAAKPAGRAPAPAPAAAAKAKPKPAKKKGK